MTDHLFNIPDSRDELQSARKRLADAENALQANADVDFEEIWPFYDEVVAAKANLERIEREKCRR